MRENPKPRGLSARVLMPRRGLSLSHPRACWLASLRPTQPTLVAHSSSFSVTYFWAPLRAWSHLTPRHTARRLRPATATHMLRLLFLVVAPGAVCGTLTGAPRRRGGTTVTRGPMVRKKFSREQVGWALSRHTLSFRLPPLGHYPRVGHVSYAWQLFTGSYARALPLLQLWDLTLLHAHTWALASTLPIVFLL